MPGSPQIDPWSPWRHVMIRIKRTYEPSARGDGQRILVERLWPRGMKKESLDADAWMKEVAPSTELRRWFDHRVERWEEFRRRYREELSRDPAAWKPLLEAEKHGTVTLLYSARDSVHNGAVVLHDYLMNRLAGADRRAKHKGKRSTANSGATASTRERNEP